MSRNYEYPDKLPEPSTRDISPPLLRAYEVAFILGLVVGMLVMLVFMTLLWGGA